MRIISFTKKWDKLNNPEFTTFRLPRRDSDKGRDWKAGEQVQVYYHNRCKDRQFYGNADIYIKTSTLLGRIDDAEAVADGFENFAEMFEWLNKAHGNNLRPATVINKLYLRYFTRPDNQ